ncbi:hypothetical protein Tco_0829590 [Tanacetum coccineum]
MRWRSYMMSMLARNQLEDVRTSMCLPWLRIRNKEIFLSLGICVQIPRSGWNGSKRGHVYKLLRSEGFVSSYDTTQHYTNTDAHMEKLLLLTLWDPFDEDEGNNFDQMGVFGITDSL